MKERWLKWREMLANGGKNRWVIFLLVGLLLLVIAIPTEEQSPEPVVQTTPVAADEQDKAEKMAARLEKVLSQVEGVGEAKVLVTLKSDGKRLVEKDSTSSLRTSSGTGEGSSTSQENALEENTVYERENGGGENPYVAETMEPEVQGVLVVAKGGDNPVIVGEITEAVQALFGIEVHKIKVMKMN